jgi:hypothetical protein
VEGRSPLLLCYHTIHLSATNTTTFATIAPTVTIVRSIIAVAVRLSRLVARRVSHNRCVFISLRAVVFSDLTIEQGLPSRLARQHVPVLEDCHVGRLQKLTAPV